MCQIDWDFFGPAQVQCAYLNFGVTPDHWIGPNPNGNDVEGVSYMALHQAGEFVGEGQIVEELHLIVYMHLLEPADEGAALQLRAFGAGDTGYWYEGSYNAAVPEGTNHSTFKYRTFGAEVWTNNSPLNATGEVVGSVDISGLFGEHEIWIPINANAVDLMNNDAAIFANGFLLQATGVIGMDTRISAIESGEGAPWFNVYGCETP
jgi:hypothetical protein